jgi:diadenosine tetraphosphate (Ap4A) HIT family hydrolase
VDDCQICAKHRGEGPLKGTLIGRWDGLWVYHFPAGDDGLAPLGYLFIESDRHAPHLEDLTNQEASALGQLRSRLAAALHEALDAEHVFAAVVGRGVPHFHEHLFVRHPGTAADVAWDDSPEAGPQADEAAVADLAARLARAVDGSAEL